MNKKIYEDALDCQDACNLSGLVHTLSGHMQAIREEVTADGGGTDEVNRHPVVQLFLSKLVSLTGGEFEPGDEAWQTCYERAGRRSPAED